MACGKVSKYEKRAMRHAENIIYIVPDVDNTRYHGSAL
jgi:hypothetical protein